VANLGDPFLAFDALLLDDDDEEAPDRPVDRPLRAVLLPDDDVVEVDDDDDDDGTGVVAVPPRDDRCVRDCDCDDDELLDELEVIFVVGVVAVAEVVVPAEEASAPLGRLTTIPSAFTVRLVLLPIDGRRDVPLSP
jgi:hypothetical protein